MTACRTSCCFLALLQRGSQRLGRNTPRQHSSIFRTTPPHEGRGLAIGPAVRCQKSGQQLWKRWPSCHHPQAERLSHLPVLQVTRCLVWCNSSLSLPTTPPDYMRSPKVMVLHFSSISLIVWCIIKHSWDSSQRGFSSVLVQTGNFIQIFPALNPD